MNIGNNTICIGIRIPVMNRNRTALRPRHLITSIPKAAPSPSAIISTSAGKVASRLFLK